MPASYFRRVLCALGLFLLCATAFGQTSATQTEVVPVPSEPNIQHFLVHTDSSLPLGKNAPRVGGVESLSQSGTDPFASNSISAGTLTASPVQGTDTWLNNALVPPDYYPSDETSVARRGNQIVIVGSGRGYYFPKDTVNQTGWGISGNAPFQDVSVATGPNNGQPGVFYAVCVNRFAPSGVIVRQSHNGGASFPTPSNLNSDDNIFIPSNGADQPYITVDNNERIWIIWNAFGPDGVTKYSYWAIVDHKKVNGVFQRNAQNHIILQPPISVHTTQMVYTGNSAPDTYNFWRLAHDPVSDRVYAIGTHVSNGGDVYVTRMIETASSNPVRDPDNAFTWPNVKANVTTGDTHFNVGMFGMRETNMTSKGAVNDKTLYIAWYADNPSTAGLSRKILLRRLFEDLNGPNTGFTKSTLWTFDGSSPLGIWNCPYRLDVVMGNRNPNTIGISFIATYMNTNVNPPTYVQSNRHILTSNDDGFGWYDTRLSSTYQNWHWRASGGHLEWYHSTIDYPTNTIHDTWVEDGMPGSHDSETFTNSILP